MGETNKLRIVIATAAAEWSGMVSAEICRENVELVGVLLDVGASRPRKKKSPEERLTLWMHLRLAWRMPQVYAKRLAAKLGWKSQTVYARLRRKEDRLLRECLRWTGREYAAELIRHRRFPRLEEVAAWFGAPFHRVDNINSEESARILRELQPDVVCALGTRIVKSHLLQIPRLGFLNGHSALLPRYRGGTSEFWQLVRGERTTGVTVHWMAPELDRGDIVTQDQWPIHRHTDHFRLRIVSQFGRLDTWRRAIRAVAAGRAGVPQGESDEPTFRRPSAVQVYRYYVHGEPPY